MPPKLQRRVTLSAGEESTVSGSGLVQVTLLTGAVDVAGHPLELNRPYSFFLVPSCRSVVLYTLEGGSVSLASDSPVAVHKGATGAATLVQFTRRTLLSLDRAVVLVIGDHRGGKTLAAHTLVNLLRRYGAEMEDGTTTGAPSRVTLLDMNAESNALFGPGCFTALEVAPGSAPLWVGNTAAPTQLPVVFFSGSATRPSSKDVNGFIHFCEQLHETAAAIAQEENQAGVSSSTGNSYGPKEFTVIDAPAPEADLKDGIFYKKLIEIVKPTHVVVVGSREKMQTGDDWCTFLQEDVQRILPDCEFTIVEPCSKPCPQTPHDVLCQEYFIGTRYFPLGCSKVVVSAQSLQFVALETEDNGGEALVARKVRAGKDWKGLVCGLSHAETVEEVPLAPTAGLILVSAVDEENDEVVLIVPAAQQEPLQRRFVVVPSGARGPESLRVSETLNATIEESIVV